MKNMIEKVLVLLFVLIVFTAETNAQAKRGIFGKSGNKTEISSKKTNSPGKAKKAQEAKLKKQKKDYQNSIKDSRKRSIDIQTPEVQARMKKNNKNADANYRNKKKKSNSSTRKAARKYN